MIIQDYANGGSLLQLLQTKTTCGQVINEKEAQKIIYLVAKSLNGIFKKGIIHRDLNVKNVMLHFSSLEPTEI